MSKPKFVSNYPHYQEGSISLMPTPERMGALDDYRGRGVVMAFVDSGFSAHPDIAERILLHVDASTRHIIEQEHIPSLSPLSWHGQMTSVIGAGDGRNSGGRYRGIASHAKLILVKVSTPQGAIKETDILRGLQWVYDTRHRYKTQIVNVSVGGDEVSLDPDHPLHIVVRKLEREGIHVVIAAGNSHKNFLLPPASAPEALTIGGYDDHNTLDAHKWTLYHHNYASIHGITKPEVLAPAAWIASPLLPGSDVEREVAWLARILHSKTKAELAHILKEGYADLGLEEDAYQRLDAELYNKLQGRIYHHKVIDAQHQHVDGTSVAAPIVASVIAQMLEVNPRLSPAQVRHLLQSTARPFPQSATQLQGAGCIQAAEAVIAARQFVAV